MSTPENSAEKAQVVLIELNRQEPPEQHALYQYDDPDADYYDGDEDCGCYVSHPRWCAWNGACCDHCTHDTTYDARYGGSR